MMSLNCIIFGMCVSILLPLLHIDHYPEWRLLPKSVETFGNNTIKYSDPWDALQPVVEELKSGKDKWGIVGSPMILWQSRSFGRLRTCECQPIASKQQTRPKPQKRRCISFAEVSQWTIHDCALPYSAEKGWRMRFDQRNSAEGYQGRLDHYPIKGYYIDLQEETLNDLQLYREKNWVDIRTRALVLDFILKDNHINRMAYIRVAAEVDSESDNIMWLTSYDLKLERTIMSSCSEGKDQREYRIGIIVICAIHFFLLLILETDFLKLRQFSIRKLHHPSLWYPGNMAVVNMAIECVCIATIVYWGLMMKASLPLCGANANLASYYDAFMVTSRYDFMLNLLGFLLVAKGMHYFIDFWCPEACFVLMVTVLPIGMMVQFVAGGSDVRCQSLWDSIFFMYKVFFFGHDLNELKHHMAPPMIILIIFYIIRMILIPVRVIFLSFLGEGAIEEEEGGGGREEEEEEEEH